ncbi:hypothetical protein ES288_A11G166300v1 [Gossypium darwinii]|uniref:Uncharacterized protein n=1 Tax=Gossypium darwinii TaxID=34276 RepID=A0A5D2EKZ6_GOSDA|nr:hypothetical protein ES288_A11G166300v1 [Gossypium darwinii]
MVFSPLFLEFSKALFQTVAGSGWAYLINTKTTRQNFHSLIKKAIREEQQQQDQKMAKKKDIKQEEEKSVYGVWDQR